MTLKNKNIIVTGSGRGIGAATAQLLAENGARLFLISKTKSEVELIASEIKKKGGWAIAESVDVSDEAAVESFFSRVAAEGGVDVLINNAATAVMKPFLELTNDDWQKTMNINLMGIVYCSRQAIKQMIPKKGGSIVNISSLGGLERLQKFDGFSAYSASKFSVVGLTECLAQEYKNSGIRVNCLAPGAVDTKMLRDAAPGFKTNTQPADVAKLVYFLCDDSASGTLTGSVLPYFCN